MASFASPEVVLLIRRVYDVAPPVSQGDKLRGILMSSICKNVKEVLTHNEAIGTALDDNHPFCRDLALGLAGCLPAVSWTPEFNCVFTCEGCQMVVTAESTAQHFCPKGCNVTVTRADQTTVTQRRRLVFRCQLSSLTSFQCPTGHRHQKPTLDTWKCTICMKAVKQVDH